MEPEARAIIAACSGLPLALNIAAARAQRDGCPLVDLATDLQSAAARLDVLDAQRRRGFRAGRKRRPEHAAVTPPVGRLQEHRRPLRATVDQGSQNQQHHGDGRQGHDGAPGEERAQGNGEEQDREADAPQDGCGVGGRVGRESCGTSHCGVRQSEVERS